MSETKEKACRACKACANYGFGCNRPMTDREVKLDVQFYVDGPVDRPDCFESEGRE